MGKSGAYLTDEARLADVIAAIQAMGRYKYYKLDFAGWADRITGDRDQADYWQRIFEEHPEFFRLNSGRTKASLVWRRQHQKGFSIDTGETISHAAYSALPPEKQSRISRQPLNSEEIKTLVNTAINMHTRELERRQDKRWWVAAALGVLGVVVGAVLGRVL